jgi:hypothetical protein
VNRKRARTAAAVLAAAAAMTAAQLGLAGTASAATTSPRSSGCPLDIVYPSRFYIDSHDWVTDGGLYFGIHNTSTKKFTKVTFSVTDVRNIRFGTATAKGGKVTHRTTKAVSVHTGTLKSRAGLGVKVHTHLLSTKSYQVRFTLHGSGWTCTTDQGTWGS